MSEPVARGAVVVAWEGEPFATLGKESLAILKALGAEARVLREAPPDADFVLLIVGQSDGPRTLPPFGDRAAVVVALGDDPAAARAAIAHARKALRAAGAALGARELVFSPGQFGVLGLESDGMREKLEILLRALLADAERLRLKREGWEEPEA